MTCIVKMRMTIIKEIDIVVKEDCSHNVVSAMDYAEDLMNNNDFNDIIFGMNYDYNHENFSETKTVWAPVSVKEVSI